MARHGAEWWAKRVEELDRGGDPEGVARRHGVRARTLIWWRSELRKRGRTGPGPRLLPVVVSAVPPRAAAALADVLEVFIEIGVTRITMRGAVSAEHVSAIVTASTRAC
jgi:hypothetical protein